MNFNRHAPSVRPYRAGKPLEEVVREKGVPAEDVVKLGSNENAYGCSPKVKRTIENSLERSIPTYPDDSCHELKRKLSLRFGLLPENLIIGCGSDQILDFCVAAKTSLKDKESVALMAGATFAMYQVYAQKHGARVVKTPSLAHDLDELSELAKRHRPDIVFLCVPNNPLGECLDAKDVFEFVENCDGDTLVVIDGAYQEYAGRRDGKKLLAVDAIKDRFENAVFTGTFSKVYGLGGMRVGYGVANPVLIDLLHRFRPPFNVGSLSLAAAIAALDDEAFVENSVKNNFVEMERYRSFLEARGFAYVESHTNFITVPCDVPDRSEAIYQTLLEQGIIVRSMSDLNCLRITLGTERQNDRTLAALDEVFRQHPPRRGRPSVSL